MTVLTDVIARLLFLPGLTVALALLVKSHSAPGDGFSAGLVAAITFLVLDVSIPSDSHLPEPVRIPRQRSLATFGLLLMVVVAFAPLMFGLEPLTHEPEGGPLKVGTLHLDTAFLFDAGIAILVVSITLFAIRLFDPTLEHEGS